MKNKRRQVLTARLSFDENVLNVSEVSSESHCGNDSVVIMGCGIVLYLVERLIKRERNENEREGRSFWRSERWTIVIICWAVVGWAGR